MTIINMFTAVVTLNHKKLTYFYSVELRAQAVATVSNKIYY
jgi:hypothetical protein